MKKTSRRNFTKSVVGAIAALPAASLARGQQQPRTTANEKTQMRRFREHNTPPPLIIESGSLILEAKTDKVTWNHATVNQRRQYRMIPKDHDGAEPPTAPGTAIYIAHVKIINGTSEVMYRFDNQTAVDVPVHVMCAMNGNANDNFHLSVDGREFVIDVPGNRKIGRKANGPMWTVNERRRPVKYLNDQGEDTHTISTIQIKKGNRTLYEIDQVDLGDAADETKIMVWWAVQ